MNDFKKFSVLYFYKDKKVGGSTNFDTLSKRYINDITLCIDKPIFKYVLKIKYIDKTHPQTFQFVERKFQEFVNLSKTVSHYEGTGGNELYNFENCGDKLKMIDEFINRSEQKYNILLELYTENEIQSLNKQFHQNYNHHQRSSNQQWGKIFFIKKERKYQTRYINECFEELCENKKCLLKAPTGSGKTKMTYDIIKKILNFDEDISLLIFFSPRILLNKQSTNEKYIHNLDDKKQVDIINLSNKDKHHKLQPEWFAATKKYIKIIILCNNSTKNLFQFFKKSKSLKGKKLFMWFDECHHTWQKNESDIQAHHNYFLNSKVNKHYRLFTSATPGDMQFNTKFYGNCIDLVTPRNLIDQKYLADLETFKYIYDGKVGDLIYGIQDLFEKNECHKGLSYHNNTNNCKSLYELMDNKFHKKQTNIKPFIYISGAKYKNEEQNFLKYNQPSILIVCQMVSFGWDNKDIDFIVFADTKNSYADIKQCIGRGLRPDGKNDDGTNKDKKLTIMLPINEKINELTKHHKYWSIINVIKILISDDYMYDLDELISGNNYYYQQNEQKCFYNQEKNNYQKSYGDVCDAKYTGNEKITEMVKDLKSLLVRKLMSLRNFCKYLWNYKINPYNYVEFQKKNEDVLPEIIELIYPKFSWAEVRKDDFHDKKKCMQVLSSIYAENEEIVDKLEFNEERLEFYHKKDNKIPNEVMLWNYYKNSDRNQFVKFGFE